MESKFIICQCPKCIQKNSNGIKVTKRTKLKHQKNFIKDCNIFQLNSVESNEYYKNLDYTHNIIATSLKNTHIQLNTSIENSESFKIIQIESDINIENNSLDYMEITIDENIKISDIENYQYQDNYDEDNQYDDKYDNDQYDDEYDNDNYQYDYENYQYNNEYYQYDNENYQYDKYNDQLEENATNYVNEMLITENEFSEDLLDENEIYDQINW
ncbi:15922_t:CDS:2, partial [Gigaspora rosea]